MSVKVCVINIGNELLLGSTVNSNLSWLGVKLAELGLPVTSSVTIMDEPNQIRETLQQEWLRNEVIIVTGGLGPTDDDLTKQVIAEFFGKKLEFRAEVWKDVQEIFARRSLTVPEINRNQAMVPEDFIALKNTVGTAPGLYYSVNGKSFFALPGVPIEMKTLFIDQIKTILSQGYSCAEVYIENIHTWNISESALAEKLKEIEVPEGVQLAWLPQTGRVDLRVYGNQLELVLKLEKLISDKIIDWIWGMGDDTPETSLLGLMVENGLTLSVAESCTGGLVQELLTKVPQSSRYFSGGIVSYSNEVKVNQLMVKPETLEQYGAVSIETAAEMAKGVRLALHTDIGLSVTGIAGPEGGSIEKPVGTVCFGISNGSEITTRKVIFNGDRNSIRWKAAEYIILLLINMMGSRE